MNNEQRIERYLKSRPPSFLVTVETVVKVLGISKSSASQILKTMVENGQVSTERVLTSGKGQPTLAYRWKL